MKATLDDFVFKTYSDGQITCLGPNEALATKIKEHSGLPWPTLWLVSPCSDYIELVKTWAACSAIRNWAVHLKLVVTGLVGMRSDRSFNGSSVDIELPASIIAKCVGDHGLAYVFEQHSDATRNTITENGASCIAYNMDWTPFLNGRLAVFPDSGARQRYAISMSTHSKVFGRKVRDANGVPSTQFAKSALARVDGSDCVIIDDYCDGGRTYINVAQTLYAAGATGVSLFVAHGLFSYGQRSLREAGIKEIRCTNSLGKSYPQNWDLSVCEVPMPAGFEN